ncbi:MAG TPA: hypothetical protein VLQ93_05945, partial [Myxococcaceae bacterium]|nr:hypothetical protein [Myxococcaceae bacterium]
LLRQAGALLLMLLTACASTTRFTSRDTAPDYTADTRWYELEVLEPGSVSTRPVQIGREEFQRALQRLARDVRLEDSPRETARQLLQAGLEGEWLAEVYRDRVLTLVPQEDGGLLAPEEEEALRRDYLRWCEGRGGGDCQALFDDGPYLRTDDRRSLALALGFSSVLDESREALVQELMDPRAVVASLVWMAGLYLMTWLVPEPTTKGLAAVLTLVLVGWLGVDAVWGLVDGWARLAHQAHEARTFDELRAAGQQYAEVIGKDAARALILAVSALMGRTVGEVAARVRTLPGYRMAVAQGEAQGVPLAVALETVETVAVSPEGALAVVMLKKGSGRAGGSATPDGPSVSIAMSHRGGNQQVVLDNGQRWHVPRGMSPRDIPAEDPLGDQLQAAANQLAKRWGPHELLDAERNAINDALKQGKYFQASRLEGQARGRWMEREMKKLFRHLQWNSKGVDITGPAGSNHHYELLSGTADNFGRHGRRMTDVFFLMIFF